LQRYAASKHIYIYSTYKLIDIGYPVVVLGVSDVRKSFYVVALAVVSDERADTFTWKFEAMCQECSSLDVQFSPVNFIAEELRR
jgi:hypothetical protein